MFSACQKRLCQDLDHRLFWSNFHAYKHAEDQWKCRAFQMKQTRFYLAKFRMPLFLCSTGYGASCYRLRTDWRCLSACAVSQMVQAQHRSFLQHVLTLKLYSYSMCIWWTNCAYCCAMCCIVCGNCWNCIHRPFLQFMWRMISSASTTMSMLCGWCLSEATGNIYTASTGSFKFIYQNRIIFGESLCMKELF